MHRLLRAAAWMTAVTAGIWAIGQVAARRIEGAVAEGDAVFRLAAVWGGRTFASTADPLLSGSAKVVVGGIDLDLTGAAPAPEGARLSLDVLVGGIRVLVPAGWRVAVAGSLQAGEVEAKVTPHADLPDDAPSLLIDVSGRVGGIVVETAATEAAPGA